MIAPPSARSVRMLSRSSIRGGVAVAVLLLVSGLALPATAAGGSAGGPSAEAVADPFAWVQKLSVTAVRQAQLARQLAEHGNVNGTWNAVSSSLVSAQSAKEQLAVVEAGGTQEQVERARQLVRNAETSALSVRAVVHVRIVERQAIRAEREAKRALEQTDLDKLEEAVDAVRSAAAQVRAVADRVAADGTPEQRTWAEQRATAAELTATSVRGLPALMRMRDIVTRTEM